MATQYFSRSLLSKHFKTPTSLLAQSFSSITTTTTTTTAVSRPSFSTLRCLFPLASLSSYSFSRSQNDPTPRWSNRPPKETILLNSYLDVKNKDYGGAMAWRIDAILQVELDQKFVTEQAQLLPDAQSMKRPKQTLRRK